MSLHQQDLLLAPHQDDESLFAAYTCIRYRPLIVYCTVPRKQKDVDPDERIAESRVAAYALGCDSETIFGCSDEYIDVEHLRSYLGDLRSLHQTEQVWAPAWEEGGHEQHNLIAEVAREVFRDCRTTPYMTYRRGQGRSVGAHRVTPTQEEMNRKRRAMDCYRTQKDRDDTGYWFQDASLWWREWYGLSYE